MQAAFGCVDPAAEVAIARALNLSRAEVHGAVSFYHDFTPEADPRPCVELCRAEACQAMGGAATQSALEAALGQKLGETKNGVTLEAVYCLGLCACAPAAMVDDRLAGRLDAAAVAEIAAEVAR